MVVWRSWMALLSLALGISRIFMGKRDWEVRTQISATDHPWMRRVEVDVFELKEGERTGPFDHTVAFLGRY